MIKDTDLFGVPIAVPRKTSGGRRIAYASRPGTGPKGQRCNTCAHCMVMQRAGKRARKCEIVAAAWTSGPETDIKHNAPACRDWQRRKYESFNPSTT